MNRCGKNEAQKVSRYKVKLSILRGRFEAASFFVGEFYGLKHRSGSI